MKGKKGKTNVKIIVEIPNNGINIFVTCTSSQCSRPYCNDALQIVTEVK